MSRSFALRRAFTLTEILVVLAIIGLLSALLFPVFGRVRERSRNTTCQSNLKQLGLAIFQYAADYDDKLPRAPNFVTKEIISRPQVVYGEPADTFVLTLPDIRFVLAPYRASFPLFRCPSDRMSPLFLADDPSRKSTQWEQWGSSYNYDELKGLSGQTLGSYKQPTQSRLMEDADDFHGTSMAESKPASEGALSNVLFADGHVKTLNWSQTISAREMAEN